MAGSCTLVYNPVEKTVTFSFWGDQNHGYPPMDVWEIDVDKITVTKQAFIALGKGVYKEIK